MVRTGSQAPGSRLQSLSSTPSEGLESLVCKVGLVPAHAAWGCCVRWANEAASVVRFASAAPAHCCSSSENPTSGGDAIQQLPGAWLTTRDLSHPQRLLVENGDKPGMGLMGSDGVSKVGRLLPSQTLSHPQLLSSSDGLLAVPPTGQQAHRPAQGLAPRPSCTQASAQLSLPPRRSSPASLSSGNPTLPPPHPRPHEHTLSACFSSLTDT